MLQGTRAFYCPDLQVAIILIAAGAGFDWAADLFYLYFDQFPGQRATPP
jgi:hypothetical protein